MYKLTTTRLNRPSHANTFGYRVANANA